MIYVDENLDENSEGEKLFCGLDSYHFCAFDINDQDARYTKVGYKDSWNFFQGQSVFNDSVYGWNGHQKNGSTLGTVEGNKL